MKRAIKNLLSVLLAAIIIATPVLGVNPTSVKAANTTYYVDSIAGNDSNNGTSASTPWQSLTKVNSVTFQPGDRILLKAGSAWNGQQLKPNGSGAPGNPIILDKYGAGNLPLISGAGVPLYAVHLYNVQHWEINNIEVTNLGASALAHRTGIVVECRDMGVCNHIYVKNVYVHDVNGLPNKNSGGDFDEGGIFYTVSGNTVPTRFNDVLIDRATVKNVDRSAIMVGGSHWGGQYNGHGGRYPQSIIDTYSHTNVIVRNSYVENAGGDAIVVLYGKAPLIEYNVSNKAASKAASVGTVAAAIWAWRGVDAVLQYNEAYDTVGNGDGQAWDADYGLRTVYQYNYSHNNTDGTVMFCLGESLESVFRYNISQNDRYLIDNHGQPSAYLYNNVIYTSSGYEFSIFRTSRGSNGKAVLNNNIFYNESTQRTRDWNGSGLTYLNNLYYGFDNHPNDSQKLIADPLFVNPGSGGIGIHTVGGYKLQATSPAIDAGILIPNNGGKDFWGNVLNDGSPDIGAFEYHSGTPIKNPFVRIEAESFDVNSGTIPENSSEGGQNLGYIDNGDYTAYNNVDFGNGALSLEARVASDTAGGTIEVRLDSPTGTLVGTCAAPGTGGWQIYTDASCSISGATGVHNLYLVYTGGFNLNHFRFVPIRSSVLQIEAESAALSGGAVAATNHTGYSGTGFVAGYGTPGANTQFNANVESAGVYNVDLRYANATGAAKTISLYVNGSKVKQISLTNLANWDTWGHGFEAVTLNAGNNTIAYKYDTGDSGNVNLDYISISNVYEAESAALSGGAVVATNHTGYSGTGFVAGYGTSGANTQFNVNVPSADIYNVDLRYANATGAAKTISLYVNGSKVKQISLPSFTNWDTWGHKFETVALNAGTNTITYKYDTGDSGNVNLDYISISNIYEAESAALSGGAVAATNHTGYSGAGFVAGYGTPGANTQFNVNVVSAGIYNVDLRYANAMGAAKTISLYVNGSKVKQISLLNLANWDTWGNEVEAVTLNAGNNTIAYKYDTGDSGNVNLDYISISNM